MTTPPTPKTPFATELHGGHVQTCWQNSALNGGCIAWDPQNKMLIFTTTDALPPGGRVVLRADKVAQDWPERPPTDEEAGAYARTLIGRGHQ